jgi:myo-inositol-1-phosphate synthase
MSEVNEIQQPNGKLGVLMPGMGAVATTFVAGVELIKKGLGEPVGSLTQLGTIRLGKLTEGRVPKIKEFVPLADLNNLVFGGWDAFPDDAYEAATVAGVLEKEHLNAVRDELKSIEPLPAVFDSRYVAKLDATYIKSCGSSRERSPSPMPRRSASADDSSAQTSGAASCSWEARAVLVRVWNW